jgi:hypothetical protein
VGRSAINSHRVLRNLPSGKSTKEWTIVVRDATQIGLLRAEGVAVNNQGRVTNKDVLWDFSPQCEDRHRAKLAAAAAAAAAPGAAAAGSAAAPIDLTGDVDEELVMDIDEGF